MRRPGRCLAALGLSACVAAPALAASFAYEVVDSEGPARAWGKAAADLDADGRTDFVLGGHAATAPGLFWYRNPDWQRTTISASAEVGTDIEVVDLDGDGRLDLVATTDTGGVPGVTAFVQTGAGWRAERLVGGLPLHDIGLADLDLDGLPDLVGRGQSRHGNAVHVWRQIAGGGWVHQRVPLPREDGDGLEVADLDLDGRPDLVVPRYWLRNIGAVGAPAFARLTYAPQAPANAVVEVGLVDLDHRPDIVLAPAHRPGDLGRLAWFGAPEDPAAGAIWAENVIEDGVEADVHFLALADFDGDGRHDLATAATEMTASPAIKIYLGTEGPQRFGPPQLVAAASSHNMQVIDLDGTGRPSLLGADYNRTGRTEVGLWRNAAP